MNSSPVRSPEHEGYTVEFKSFVGGVSSKELASTLCACANTDGGSVFIGVTDSRDIVGVKVTPELLDQVLNASSPDISYHSYCGE